MYVRNSGKLREGLKLQKSSMTRIALQEAKSWLKGLSHGDGEMALKLRALTAYQKTILSIHMGAFPGDPTPPYFTQCTADFQTASLVTETLLCMMAADAI